MACAILSPDRSGVCWHNLRTDPCAALAKAAAALLIVDAFPAVALLTLSERRVQARQTFERCLASDVLFGGEGTDPVARCYWHDLFAQAAVMPMR
jgi:hypothetical protein